MGLKDDLSKLKKEQEQLLVQMDLLLKGSEEISQFEQHDKLVEKIESLKGQSGKLEKQIKELEAENQRLRIALKEQIIDEKLSLIKASEEKLVLYFDKGEGSTRNKLKESERQLQQKIIKLEELAQKEITDQNQEILDELGFFRGKIQEKLKSLELEQDKRAKSLREQIKHEMELFRQKPVDEKTVEKRIKQNKLEMKIGLSLLNKVGVILLLIGIGVATKYSMGFFNAYVKGSLFFLTGTVLMLLGDFSHRKNQDLFSKSLIGAGLAVLYSSLFYSHYGLYIISIEMGLFLSLLITALTVVLSFRYQSQTVLAYALIGGFLPVVTFVLNNGLNNLGVWVVMGYLLILNSVVLIISLYRKWSLNFILSFALNFPALILIVLEVEPVWLGIAYTLINFLLYLAVILGYPLRKKENLNLAQLVLLALNTTITAFLVFILFSKLNLWNLKGSIALIYSVVYYLIAQLVRKKIPRAENSVILFYLTSLTFAILMIPFQFGGQWIVVGWLLEGTFLTLFGYLHKSKAMEKAGWIIFGLCFLTFYLFDLRVTFLLGEVHAVTALFFIGGILLSAFSAEKKSAVMRYSGLLLITMAVFSLMYQSLIGYYWDFSWSQLNFKYISLSALFSVLFIYFERERLRLSWGAFELRSRLLTFIKPIYLVHMFVFVSHIILYYFNKWFLKAHGFADFELLDTVRGNFLFFFPLSLVAMGASVLLNKLKIFEDKVSRIIGIIFNLLGVFLFFFLLVATPLGSAFELFSSYYWVFYGIFFALNLLMLYNFRLLLLRVFKKYQLNFEFYPVWFNIWLLFNLILQCTVHLDVAFTSLLISFLMLVMAIGMIIYGFSRKFLYVRLSGLILVVLSLAKLFLWDLSDLGAKGKILAYFGFGILLLAISYIYQRVDRALKKNMGEGRLDEK